jgi:hypothetical protein
MENDIQLTHHLWWLKKFLNRDMGTSDNPEEYKRIIHKDLSSDVKREVDSLVAHIKLNY